MYLRLDLLLKNSHSTVEFSVFSVTVASSKTLDEHEESTLLLSNVVAISASSSVNSDNKVYLYRCTSPNVLQYVWHDR